MVRGFYPLFRLSNRFLRVLDQEYQRGWHGHYELTWGTIARRNGLAIEDIGGNGRYVKSHNCDMFYFNTFYTQSLSPGTFVFRPALTTVRKRENTLWHPVKPAGTYFNWVPLHLDVWETLHPREWFNPLLRKTMVELWFRYRCAKQSRRTRRGRDLDRMDDSRRHRLRNHSPGRGAMPFAVSDHRQPQPKPT